LLFRRPQSAPQKTLSDFAAGGCLMGEMQDKSDTQLLRDYAERGCEPAFREIVTRHTDLVYSAALRCVTSPDLAGDIAQSVFTDLARKARPLAGKLADNTSLIGWLYRSTRFAALNQLRDDHRRFAHERQAMEQLLSHSESAPDWDRIGPVLDEAMDNLSNEDRDALLLRYFENKSLREVGQTLGTSDDTAQKRVSRAVERLREFFAKRGVTVGAGGLAVALATNAVQAAPAGLIATISIAVLAGTAVSTSTAIAVTKAIAMTTLQKIIITVTIATAMGTGIYEARQVSTLRTQVQTLRQQQALLAEQNQQLLREHDAATHQFAALRDDNERLNQNTTELLKLRGEVARLRNAASQANDPLVQTTLAGKAKGAKLRQLFEQMPDQQVPEMQLLSDQQWLDIARDADLDSKTGISKAMRTVRQTAKNNFAPQMAKALKEFVEANNGQLPNDLFQLKPYFKSPVNDAMLQQYKLLFTGKMSDLQSGEWIVADQSVLDQGYGESLRKIGLNGYTRPESEPREDEQVTALARELGPAIKAYSNANAGLTPTNFDQLKPYVTTPAQDAALQQLIKIGVRLSDK
jgi:RNA polymerase sigma factor (sigma-70 family)